MQRAPYFFTIMIAASATVGCQTNAEKAELTNPSFYVPTTMILQPRQPAAEAAIEPVTPLASQVLGLPPYDFFFVGRSEKAFYTALPLAEISAYSVYTFDAQRISGPDQSGYRYTSLVREGVFAP